MNYHANLVSYFLTGGERPLAHKKENLKMFDGQLNNDSAVDNGIHMSEERQMELMRELTGDDEYIAGCALADIMAAYRKPLEYRARIAMPDYDMAGAVADPESLVQDAFQSLWESREKLNPESVRIYKWLLTAVKRRAQNEKRNAQSRQTTSEPMGPAPAVNQFGEEIETPYWETDSIEPPAPTPDVIAERNELGVLIAEARENALNEREREAITLKLDNNETFNVVAERLGCKLATAKSTVRNAKKKLRAYLEPRLKD